MAQGNYAQPEPFFQRFQGFFSRRLLPLHGLQTFDRMARGRRHKKKHRPQPVLLLGRIWNSDSDQQINYQYSQ